MDPLTILQLGSTGAGILGSIFGQDEAKTGRFTTRTTRRSPEMMQAMQYLLQMYKEGIDVDQLKRISKERLGTQGSAMRQSAISRLRKSNVPAPVLEQILSGMSVESGRGIEEALANLDVYGKEFQLKPLGMFGDLARDIDVTQTGTQYGMGGQGYGALMSAGLTGLLSNPEFNNLFKKKGASTSTGWEPSFAKYGYRP